MRLYFKKSKKIVDFSDFLPFCQAVGALGELSDKSDFSLFTWDSFSQEIHELFLFYCQKSLNLLQMQCFSS